MLELRSRMTLSAYLSADLIALSAEHADPVRLACVRRAASVRPEPGSNPQINLFERIPRTSVRAILTSNYCCLFSRLRYSKCTWTTPSAHVLRLTGPLIHCSIFNVHAALLWRSSRLRSVHRIAEFNSITSVTLCQQLFRLISTFSFPSSRLLISLKSGDRY